MSGTIPRSGDALMLSDIEEHFLQHLDEVDHWGVQLLTGHGAFGNYLHKHNKREDTLCPLCEEELDNPVHALLECRMVEIQRQRIEDAALRLGIERPWDLRLLLRKKEIFEVVMAIWKEIHLERDL